MNNKGLTDKEAALLAAARRELAKPGANDLARIAAAAAPAPRPSRALPLIAITADPPPEPDISTRVAMLVQAERQAYENRKRRIGRNYVILVSVVMVPAFLYVFVTLFRLLAR